MQCEHFQVEFLLNDNDFVEEILKQNIVLHKPIS
jgi:hypothetical protein